MNENVPQGGPTGIPYQVDFASRPPSQGWESIPLPDAPQFCIWGWFKPAHAPQGIIFQIPNETVQGYPNISQLTMRTLVQLVGIHPAMVTGWFLNGVNHDSMQGASPLFDQPLPAAVAGMDPNILVYVNLPVTQQGVPQQQAIHQPVIDQASMPVAGQNIEAATNVPANLEETFSRIEVDWRESMAIIRKLSSKRKELVDMVAKMKSLNRELSVDEGLHASQQDKLEWRDARRFLRDINNKLDMYIKQHDVGVTSFAGKREWFEKIFNQNIMPRVYFDELYQAERDFTQYRKSLQTLISRMDSSNVQAGRDGENRARQVLSKIAAKVRTGQTKRYDH